MASDTITLAPSYYDVYSLTTAVDKEPGLSTITSREPVGGPHKFLIKRTGCWNWNVAIHKLRSESSQQQQALVADKPARWWKGNRRAAREVAEDVPSYFVSYVRGHATLYEGPGPEVSGTASKRVMEAKDEGYFNTKSTYTELDGRRRSTQMAKARGPGGDSWWSCDRTLTDFEGQTYKWRNSWGDLTCVRSDGVVVARFRLDWASWAKVGVLEIEEVPTSLFNLIVSSHFIRWRDDNERRLRSRY